MLAVTWRRTSCISFSLLVVIQIVDTIEKLFFRTYFPKTELQSLFFFFLHLRTLDGFILKMYLLPVTGAHAVCLVYVLKIKKYLAILEQ